MDFLSGEWGMASDTLPSRRIWWTLPKAIGWLLYRRETAFPKIETLSAFGVLNEFVREGNDEQAARAIALRDEFLEKLAAGAVVIMAASTQSGKVEPVPAAEWTRLDPLYGESLNFLFDALGNSFDDKPSYFNAVVAAADIRRIWPAMVVTRKLTESEVREAISESGKRLGRPLYGRELEELRQKICEEKIAKFPRDNFFDIAKGVQGHIPRGRPKKPK